MLYPVGLTEIKTSKVRMVETVAGGTSEKVAASSGEIAEESRESSARRHREAGEIHGRLDADGKGGTSIYDVVLFRRDCGRSSNPNPMPPRPSSPVAGSGTATVCTAIVAPFFRIVAKSKLPAIAASELSMTNSTLSVVSAMSIKKPRSQRVADPPR